MIKINKLKEKKDVYDIQVLETNNFYANDILVHNCEIFQATDPNTTAICTLSSMVIKNFIIDGKFDYKLLFKETRKVVKALNKVIDINSYSTEKGKKGGLDQRAIAIGVQGLADVFFLLDLEFTSNEAKEINKKIFETIYFAAVTESCELCKSGEYKPYKHFKGSPMSKGIFQFDMWELNKEDLSGLWDWDKLKEEVKQHGVCNSLMTTQMPVACQTIGTKIRTQFGIKSFKEILNDNEINYNEIENDIVGKYWIDFKEPVFVETMNGLKESNKIYYNGHAEIIKIEMEDGFIFECSEEHKFLVDNNWIKASELKEEQKIENTLTDKATEIKKITKTGEKKPLWDIEVQDGHHYILENGCVSHNSSAKVTGSFEMTEPAHSALFNRRVIGGEITIVNRYLIEDFEKLGLWNEKLKNEIILNEGSIQNINFNKYLDPEEKNYEKKIARLEHLISKYKTIWEIKQKDLIDMAADRGPFIDQSQSMNIYMGNPTLSKLTSSHFYAWNKKLKTLNYYVRSKAISTGAKHLALDMSENKVQVQSKVEKVEEPKIEALPPKPENSEFDCFGCSS